MGVSLNQFVNDALVSYSASSESRKITKMLEAVLEENRNLRKEVQTLSAQLLARKDERMSSTQEIQEEPLKYSNDAGSNVRFFPGNLGKHDQLEENSKVAGECK